MVIYGEVPESRWGHQMCTNQTHSVIAIFGGMNLKGFCEANSYSIQIGKSERSKFFLGDDVVIEKVKQIRGLSESVLIAEQKKALLEEINQGNLE